MQISSALEYLISLAVLGLLLGAAPARAGEGLIREIEISGTQRMTAETVLDTISLKKGERYEAVRADQSIKALFATGQYQDVRIAYNNGRVSVALKESPTVDTVSYTGAKALKSDRFKDVVKLKKGGVFSKARADADMRAIRDVYRSEGRLTTKIAVQTAEKPNNKIDVVFSIAEGEVNRVSSIIFEGNGAFPASQLEGVIKTSQSSWLDILKSSSVYVADRIEEDRELLLRHHLTHGYAGAKVVAAEATPDADGKGYTVRFVIDEGERFHIGNVSMDVSLDGVSKEALAPLILVKSGDDYDAAAIAKSTEAMILSLWDAGVKFARVKPQLTRDSAAHRIDIAYRVDEGPHVTVERVEVKGNTKTDLEVILREMRLKEGEAFSDVVLERDRVRIKALGIFKNVTASAAKGTSPDSAIVMVEVVEDETITLSVGGGYSSNEGIIADIAVEDKNLLGTGRWGKVKLAGSLYKLQAEPSFTEPHLLGTDLSGGFDLFYKDYDASEQSSFKSRKIGGDVRLGYQLSETWSGSANYTFTQNRIYDVSAAASPAIRDAVRGFPAVTQDTYYTSSVGYSLAYDTRNSRRLPASGSSFVLTQDFAGLGGDVRYIKSTVDARTYFELNKNVTLVGRATAGNITGWGGQDVRLLDMYYMGGETVRGFALAGIGPRDTWSANQDALGGTSYISTTAEARFNLPLVPEEIGLRGAVFADAGSLFGTSANAKKLPGLAGSAASLRSSAGVGLIWDSPIGPLRADYAFPLTKQPFDKTQPWSFGLAAF